jgi:hypothetical protein
MANVSPAWAAHRFYLAHGKWREIVMVEKMVFGVNFYVFYNVLVVWGVEG